MIGLMQKNNRRVLKRRLMSFFASGVFCTNLGRNNKRLKQL
ncbi:hypothetical protein CIT292_06508 [Citrobacter youngae ATCC 29220]|uniref:Uncharacterized protein n=1 Tax=Citrobacter youngae ATCC 29220 TaxID=500640 RepID=D4B8G6_9ENTR|nr:hypothetical protein CIT292_06508 [Citrobacter youngae ATCC 29220]